MDREGEKILREMDRLREEISERQGHLKDHKISLVKVVLAMDLPELLTVNETALRRIYSR